MSAATARRGPRPEWRHPGRRHGEPSPVSRQLAAQPRWVQHLVHATAETITFLVIIYRPLTWALWAVLVVALLLD